MSTPAWSLGLGEIDLQSALNEEFVASIELLDAQGLQPDEVLVSLASTEDFNRVGVERFFFLTDLKFQVISAANGSAQVQITSSRPITEPYLNFLVQVLWPSGRLLKEYTVLLDPPTFSAAAAPAVRAPAQDRAAAGSGQVQRSAGQGRPADRVQVAPAASVARDGATSALDEDVVGNEFRMTDRDDTLWSIASRSRPSAAVSVQQNMLAIQQLNPDAFINGNINLLKAGYSLRLPDERQALALSDGEALAEVSRQNSEWQAINRGEQIASRGETQSTTQTTRTADAAPATSRSPVDASSRSTGTTPARQTDGELKIIADDGDSVVGVADASGSGQSAAILEENDRLAREVEQLASQLDREKDIASDQIAVKERQLEVKDQQIAELQAQLAAAQQQAASAPAQSQNQSAAPRPDQAWWQSPLVLYGGVGALVLLLAGWMVRARRRREEDDFYADSEAISEDRHEPALGQASGTPAEADLEDFEDEEPVAREADSSEHEVPDSETSDVIGEADIYIAYGRYPQAIGLLLGVLDEDATRNDVRLKLLEVYAETSDREAFDTHMAALIEHCDEEDALLTARDLEARFGEGPISLDEMVQEPDEPASTAIASRAATTTRTAADALDFDTGLDGQAEAAEEVEPRDRPIDFKLEIDDAATDEEVESPPTSGAGDELGGDLGIDFNPDREDTDTLTIDGESDDDAVAALDELSLDDSSEFEFDDEGDSANTKLDLARAYIDMGDADGARDILKEVIDEGNSEQQQRAQSMLEAL
ncbi:MAG: FimV/HubP family polar landmark protein [Pseudomonadales bacterium]